jgi:drug/metabolite transporter (DMT)-like permease
MNTKNNYKGVFFAALTSFLFGILPIFLKYALFFVSINTLNWVRCIFGVIFLGFFLYKKNPEQLKIIPRAPFLGILTGLALAINYLTYALGIKMTSPSNAQVLIQTAPLLLILAGFIFFKERIAKIQGFGFFLAILGFILFYLDQIKHFLGDPNIYSMGNMMVLIAAMAMVVWSILQKILVRTWSPTQITFLLFVVASMVFTPLANFSELLNLSLFNSLILIMVGLLTAVSFVTFAHALALMPISQLSVIITVNPLVTLVVMAILAFLQINWAQQETITLAGYLGAFLLIFGVVLAQIGKRAIQIFSRTAGKNI